MGEWTLTGQDGLLSKERVRRAGLGVAVAARRDGGATAGREAATRAFLALATLGEHALSADQWNAWAGEFAVGFNAGLSPAGEQMRAVLGAGRPLVVEITESMLGEAPSAQDETRLAELKGLLSRKNDLSAGQLTWVLPRGAGDLARLPRALAGLRAIRANVRVKSEIPMSDGKRSVKALLLDVQGRSRVGDLASTDLFLMDRSEWVVEADLPKDVVRLLIALTGGLVVDATNLLAEEIKSLFYLQTNA